MRDLVAGPLVTSHLDKVIAGDVFMNFLEANATEYSRSLRALQSWTPLSPIANYSIFLARYYTIHNYKK